MEAATGELNPAPLARVAGSIPWMISRAGWRPSTSPKATASARPPWWLLGAADHPGNGVDSAGSRMNIENAADTFPTLAPGTYEVTAFSYSAGTDTSDLQPFLAVNTGGDEYLVLWAGPAAAASGSNSVTTVPRATARFTRD